MFCGKCGARCNEGAKFCRECGAPLISAAPKNDTPIPPADQEYTPAQSGDGWFKRNRRAALAILIIIIAVVVAVIAVVLVRHFSKQEDLSPEDHMELGIIYMDEGKYEEAVAEFTSVIDVEPDMQAYQYLADSYLALSEEEPEEEVYAELAGDVYGDAVAFALDSYGQTGELPEFTEDLYEDATVYEASREEVVQLDELGEVITLSLNDTEEVIEAGEPVESEEIIEAGEVPDLSEESEDAEEHDLNQMYLSFYKKVQDSLDSYGEGTVIDPYGGYQVYIDGLAVVQVIDMNDDGQDELLMVYNEPVEDGSFLMPNYTVDIWEYNWEDELNPLKRIYSKWLSTPTDEDFSFEILEKDDKYWFEEYGNMINIVDDESIPEDEWDGSGSETAAEYPLVSYDSDFTEELNDTLSKTDEAVDALIETLNGPGDWQDIYREYAAGTLWYYDVDEGYSVKYEHDPDSTYTYALIYLDDDDIPELLSYEVKDDNSSGGSPLSYNLYTVRDGKLTTVTYGAGTSLDLYYIENSSLFYQSSVNSDYTIDTVYRMVNGGTWYTDSETVYSLVYVPDSGEYYEDYGVTVSGSGTYTMSNTPLSKAEYENNKEQLGAYFKDNGGMTPALVSEDELISQIDDLSK